MTTQTKSRLGIVTTLAIGFVLSLWATLLLIVAVSAQNGSLLALWSTINDGQAQVISSSIAALGILTSAVLVPFIFKDRIRDLDSAVSDMKNKIETFGENAGARLEALSKLFDEKMSDAEKRTSTDADRIGEVLEEIRSAVILSVSAGHITDPKHAKVFAQHMYNDAVPALQRRVKEKLYLRETTRAQIAGLRTMSADYLDKLVDAQIISPIERSIIDRVKYYAYRRSDFAVSEINDINKTRMDFDRAFGESGIQNPDTDQKSSPSPAPLQ